jgi:hypothetical protein
MILLVKIEIDDERADAANARLFHPELGDPVVGDGRSLVRDIVRDGELAALLDDRHFAARTTVTLDGDEIPRGQRL